MFADYGCYYGYNHLLASNFEQWCSNRFYHDYAGGCGDKSGSCSIVPAIQMVVFAKNLEQVTVMEAVRTE